MVIFRGGCGALVDDGVEAGMEPTAAGGAEDGAGCGDLLEGLLSMQEAGDEGQGAQEEAVGGEPGSAGQVGAAEVGDEGANFETEEGELGGEGWAFSSKVAEVGTRGLGEEGGAAMVAVANGWVEIGVGVDPAAGWVGVVQGPLLAGAAGDGGGGADAAGG
jgi:hypothetical protein